MLKTRFGIAALIYAMINAVLFGAGLIILLLVPALATYAMELIPLLVLTSFVVAMPIAWQLAPALLARYERRRMAAS
ncbi:hypothetical protein BJ122_11065 [Rhodopseudomonas faecalis]|uniref:Uncharacterized protein n=1 Tax=Rhodopseudomonas faecalis TaxID=99655 RepID=A0A318TI24_9BRAD|nr:hypothetical protein [Rhodopseudomonas faecalis]PYF02728.1 hypothetical protein BJ122_11065 [Rhodopseudomonas faecalis]